MAGADVVKAILTIIVTAGVLVLVLWATGMIGGMEGSYWEPVGRSSMTFDIFR